MSEIRRTGSPDQVFGPDPDEPRECPHCGDLMGTEAVRVDGVWQHSRCSPNRARAVMAIAHALGDFAFSQWFSLTRAQRADLVEAADRLLTAYQESKDNHE